MAAVMVRRGISARARSDDAREITAKAFRGLLQRIEEHAC